MELTQEERVQLQRWARRRTSSQALALRSRIVLGCASGLSNKDVAVREGVTQPTVGKWRSRFVELRLDGLGDDPRPGRPPSIAAEQVEDVVVATLESTPANATHWSRAKMAQRSGLSKSSIGRIWRAFELKPHRADSFKLSNDPLFVEKVFDVIGLYLNPPEAAVVLCVDELCDASHNSSDPDLSARLRPGCLASWRRGAAVVWVAKALMHADRSSMSVPIRGCLGRVGSVSAADARAGPMAGRPRRRGTAVVVKVGRSAEGG